MIRILLVDDHMLVRAGLRAVLELQDDFEIRAEAATIDAAVDRARVGDIDLVLMDLQFGDRPDGIEGTRRIRALPGGPRVLVLTTYDIDSDVLAAVEAGAVGYLLKDASADDLAAGVRAAAAGETVLAPAIAQRLVQRTLQPQRTLSPREVQVLDLVARGLSNDAIGKLLFLSQATVKSHLVHVFTKLGVDSRTAAVATARSQRLIR